MGTTMTVPTLVAAFTNERLGLCANVRELSASEEFEVAVVDAFSVDVVVSRSFGTKEVSVKTAETLIDIGSLPDRRPTRRASVDDRHAERDRKSVV